MHPVVRYPYSIVWFISLTVLNSASLDSIMDFTAPLWRSFSVHLHPTFVNEWFVTVLYVRVDKFTVLLTGYNDVLDSIFSIYYRHFFSCVFPSSDSVHSKYHGFPDSCSWSTEKKYFTDSTAFVNRSAKNCVRLTCGSGRPRHLEDQDFSWVLWVGGAQDQ